MPYRSYLILSKEAGPLGAATRRPSWLRFGSAIPSSGLHLSELKCAAPPVTDPEVALAFPRRPFYLELVTPAQGELANDLVADPVPGGVAWGIRAIGAENIPIPKDGNKIKVAVLDTGIDHRHPAFVNRTFDSGRGGHLQDFTSDARSRVLPATLAATRDDDGHGTHCAATIAGRAVDGIRIGVAPEITDLYVGKIVKRMGRQLVVHPEWLLNAFMWCVAERIDVISLSIRLNQELLDQEFGRMPDRDRAEAVEDLKAYQDSFSHLGRFLETLPSLLGKPPLIVAAAGNDSERPERIAPAGLPANCHGFVSVGAVQRVNQNDAYRLAPYSNSGVHLVAPGTNVISAAVGRANNRLAPRSGTSMAVPHVAGIAALLFRKHSAIPSPAERYRRVREELLQGDRSRLGEDAGDTASTGAGMAVFRP